MISLSVVIITFNEERNILNCLQSVEGIADEIIVLDSFSKDRTKEICLREKVKFYERAFTGFNDQKNYALSLASSPYILSLDADEVLSPELKKSIQAAKENWVSDGYTMNRLTNYCGTWIRHCWYPDTKLRMWDLRKGNWDCNKIHEKVDLADGATISHLQGDLLHYSYHTLDDHLRQLHKFNEIAAISAYNDNKKSSFLKLFYKPVAIFFKLYILKQGFRDGYSGFLIARISAFGAFMKYARLKQLNESNSRINR
jgi:glycosyltransferase involved in cell wall biosynthesis